MQFGHINSYSYLINGMPMKSLSQKNKQSISMEVTSLATCWKISLTNGQVLSFTDHCNTLNIEGNDYLPDSGSTSNEIENSGSITSLPFSIEGFISNSAISKSDLQSGKFDRAKLEIFMVDYAQPESGKIPIKQGYISSITMYDDFFVAGIAGVVQGKQVGKCYSLMCRAQLGDNMCKVNLQNMTFSGTIETIVQNNIFVDSSLNQQVGYFTNGSIKFTSGANSGIQIGIVKHTSGGKIEMFAAPFYPIKIGEQYQIKVGCDKLFSTCGSKFSNTDNFRGEPHIKSHAEIYSRS